ncbi:MAG: DUF937 domain-containing protein [Bacteroidota bacterium]|nr:DUF937 domain-containing protein [Bacteroidota bacterium]
MFDNLLKLVQENAGDAIINNTAIPNEKNNLAINETTHSIFNTLKSQANGGGMNNIMDMFNSATPPNTEISNSLNSNVTNNLISKLGVTNSQAATIATTLIPKVMGQMVNKTNDPNDNSFDMKSILGALGGGSSSDVLGGIGNMFK